MNPMRYADEDPTYPAGIPGYAAGLRGRLSSSREQHFVPPATSARCLADIRAFLGGPGRGGLLDDPRIATNPDAVQAIKEWFEGPTPSAISLRPGDLPETSPRSATHGL